MCGELSSIEGGRCYGSAVCSAHPERRPQAIARSGWAPISTLMTSTSHEKYMDGSGKDGLFASLERRTVDALPARDLGLQRDRWWLGFIALGVLLALLPLERLTGWPAMRWLQVVGLALQLVGLCVFSWRQARDVLPDFVDAKRKFAEDMDSHFARRESVLQWLRSVPAVELEARTAYVEDRLEALRSRYILIFGAVDKLGVLPVFGGVFVQLRGLMSMSFGLVLAGAGIGLLYAMALWVSRFRLQMEGYIRLMRAASVRAP